MSGKTTAESLEECSLEDRILLTLHLADRRGYGMCLLHISKMLIYGEAEEEQAKLMLSSMPLVSLQNGIYCLRGSENLLSETRRRLLCNGVIVERYESEAVLFSTEYASLCPFIKCIAIAGSMASGGFSEEDDIDINIFTERGCKYTAYLLGILLSLKYSVKHRRKSSFLWKLVQFSRRNNPEALSRVRWVTKMQKPYALFGDRI